MTSAIRPATPADAATIARHRAAMWQDIVTSEGRSAPPDLEESVALWASWLAGALGSGEYLGWLAEAGGEVIAGVGLMRRPRMPTPTQPSATGAHIMNLWTHPAHRGRGLGRTLMQAALAGARAHGLYAVSLNASAAGRSLYDSLGFVLAGSPEMRLSLESA